ncbi:hypothetical protein PR048_018900 [Dryococelus australis]|uniref:Uncharacterized protein n=1 Tax=Dryococelus australis TaxID=614101 RepID=A0ABQ9H1Y8_9NEOP|nr:hypothetical protein PR048_018900 [Dryococelus australis]
MRMIEVRMEQRRNEREGVGVKIPEKTRRPTASSVSCEKFHQANLNVSYGELWTDPRWLGLVPLNSSKLPAACTDAARVLVSQTGKTGSIPVGDIPGFSHVGIVQDYAAGRRVFSGICRFFPPLHSGAAPCSPRFTIIGSLDPTLRVYATLAYSDLSRKCRAVCLQRFFQIVYLDDPVHSLIPDCIVCFVVLNRIVYLDDPVHSLIPDCIVCFVVLNRIVYLDDPVHSLIPDCIVCFVALNRIVYLDDPVHSLIPDCIVCFVVLNRIVYLDDTVHSLIPDCIVCFVVLNRIVYLDDPVHSLIPDCIVCFVVLNRIVYLDDHVHSLIPDCIVCFVVLNRIVYLDDHVHSLIPDCIDSLLDDPVHSLIPDCIVYFVALNRIVYLDDPVHSLIPDCIVCFVVLNRIVYLDDHVHSLIPDCIVCFVALNRIVYLDDPVHSLIPDCIVCFVVLNRIVYLDLVGIVHMAFIPQGGNVNMARYMEILSHQGGDAAHEAAVCHRVFTPSTSISLIPPVSLLAPHQGEPGTILAGSPHIRMLESCRTIPLVDGFSRGSPVSSDLSFRRCSISTRLVSPSLALKIFEPLHSLTSIAILVTRTDGKCELQLLVWMPLDDTVAITKKRGLILMEWNVDARSTFPTATGMWYSRLQKCSSTSTTVPQREREREREEREREREREIERERGREGVGEGEREGGGYDWSSLPLAPRGSKLFDVDGTFCLAHLHYLSLHIAPHKLKAGQSPPSWISGISAPSVQRRCGIVAAV